VGGRDRIDPKVHMFPGVFHSEHKLLTSAKLRHTSMSAERQSDPKDHRVKVRSTDLDAPTLVDRMSAELLDHLMACRVCSSIFAGQEQSLGEAGCVEGQRIVSESKVRWQERRANLALKHLSDETLDDYIFNRLACDEWQPVEHHLSRCPQCAKAIQNRETLATWIRAAFQEREHNRNAPSTSTGVIQVQCSARALSVCLKSKLGKNR
jgi:hypothetical protein